MLFPNAWFSKIGLLVVGALLWGGGVQAGTSLESLSKESGVTCKQGDLRSCLIYYYLVEPDVNGELKGLSDGASGSELSPRLEKVYVLLDKKPRSDGQKLLYEFIEEELEQLHAPANASPEEKEKVAQRWAAFAFMLNRLDPARVGNDTVFGYAQDDVSLKSTFRDIDEQLDSSVSKESNLRELIIRWTNFMLPMAATLAALGLVWAGFCISPVFKMKAAWRKPKR